jgi:hypothetical protein
MSVRQKRAALSPALWYIEGRAYDLSKWSGHPGGQYILNITRGTDCTELFESYHAPSLRTAFIQEKLASCAVPDATAPPPPIEYDWCTTPVYDELKTIVRAYRRRHGIKAVDSARYVLWYGVWAAVHYVTMARWCMGWGGWVNGWLFGTAVWFWAADTTHSGTHYQLTHRAALSEWIAWLGGATFMNTSAWVRQHVTGHHSHTNQLEQDPDLCLQRESNSQSPDRARPAC